MVALFVDLPIKIYAQQAPSRPEGLGAPWKVDPRHIAICSPRESCLLCTATKPWGLNRVSPDCSLPTRASARPVWGGEPVSDSWEAEASPPLAGCSQVDAFGHGPAHRIEILQIPPDAAGSVDHPIDLRIALHRSEENELPGVEQARS
jgi:hypothetical protein